MLQKIYDAAADFIGKIKPQPLTVEVEGEHYRLEPGPHGLAVGGHILKPGPTARSTLTLQTLTGFVDAYTAKIDSFEDKVAVHVLDPVTVVLKSLEADAFGRRHEFVRTTCLEKNPFPFGEYQVTEQFLIALAGGFLPTEEVISLQKLASSLTSESSIAVQDDGLAQSVTVKQGAVQRVSVSLPPRISLFAYRTFREIDPVASEFIVRLKAEKDQVPKIALLDVDAGKWKLNSMTLMARWLQEKLPNAVVIA